MKIYIAFDLRDEPAGGGNQFLKALRVYLRSAGAYAERMNEANVILANGHQWGPYLFQLFLAKRARPDLVIVHRVDGPMAVVRGDEKKNRIVDDAIVSFNNRFADGTVFQSRWSRDLCLIQGMEASKHQATILNAPDSSIFYPPVRKIVGDGKIRIVSTSWSGNWRKGFDVFQYLDQHLDFSRFTFTFIGNSPVKFENIRHIAPIPSAALADELRNHDIFLQASHLEACSNSLIEAMNCGLVPVAKNNSSHPEIVDEAGVLFEGIEDVIAAIDVAAKGQAKYLAKRSHRITMDCAGRAYLDFASEVSQAPLTRPGLTELLVAWASWKMARRPAMFLWLRILVGKLRRR
jgi:glycosyltransferase involved in cell wall biosynthesis